ncbi:MAG: hypothetical protein HYZ54_01515 [Ignavibacteriae bacterium]|nr:hypothetical protein [Ignavibacteriota bacterium]
MNDDTMIPDSADVEKNKVMAIIAYLGCLCLVPLFAAKDSPFARYHANQGLVLLLFSILLSGVGFMIDIGMLSFVLLALRLGILVLMILGIMNAAQGKMKPLPLIGGISLIN